MHTLKRNQQTITYSLYQGQTEKVDENGDYTGEKELSYSIPVSMRMFVSASKGEADIERFGIDVKYSRTMTTDMMNCPIDEYTRLWIDTSPNEDYSNNDYYVTKVAKSLNNIVYAIEETKHGSQ